MKLVSKRTAALLLTLCLMVSLCSSLSVWAVDTTVTASSDGGVVDYRLFYDGLKDYDAQGVVNILKNSDNLDELERQYNGGTINFLPYAYGGGGTAYFNDGITYTTNHGAFQGVQIFQGNEGSYVAFKIKSPGADTYSVSLNYFYKNDNVAADYGVYLLSASTEASAVEAALTDDNKIGTVSVESWNHTKGGTYSGVANAKYTVESASEYILAIKAEKDNASAEAGRIDMCIQGLTFVPEGSVPSLLGGIPPQIANESLVATAEFYKAINGVNPHNGHELLYLLFKGSNMWVYDITAGKMVETINDSYYLMNHPNDVCFDQYGSLWICGSGRNLTRYTPPKDGQTSGKLERIQLPKIGEQIDSVWFDEDPESLYAVTYYNDGTNERLYFGTCNQAGLGYVDLKFNVEKDAKGNVTDSSVSNATFHCISKNLNADARFSGRGGITIRQETTGTYLYTTVDGDVDSNGLATHAIIKFDLNKNTLVGSISLTDYTVSTMEAISRMNYAFDKLFITCSQKGTRPLVIDISGNTMQLMDETAITGLDRSLNGMMSDKVDGKVYFVKSDGKDFYLHSYDGKTVENLNILAPVSLQSEGAVATLNSNTVIVAPKNADGGIINLYLYDITNKTVNKPIEIKADTESSTGTTIQALTINASGRYIFAGGYGTPTVGWYDIVTEQTGILPGYGHQSDSMQWYQDTLWVGNYNQGTITRFAFTQDTEGNWTATPKPLMNLMESAFQQKRMLGGLAVGDGKVFCGTVPDTGMLGGALTWYDGSGERERIYVAIGPDSDDVFYTEELNIATEKTDNTEVYSWKYAIDGAPADFLDDKTNAWLKDENGDYILDVNDGRKQRFAGVIENMCINCVVYYNGYIIGCTTRQNGSDTELVDDEPKLFVYDVKNFQVLCHKNLSEIDANFAASIGLINAIAADPYEPGKFWGVAANKLFSFTVSADGQIENLTDANLPCNAKDNSWADKSDRSHTSIIFDGEYLYTGIYGLGTCMVNTEDTADYKILTAEPSQLMVQGQDGNLYYLAKSHRNDLMMLPSAIYTNHIVAQSVQERINALEQNPNREDATIARRMFDALNAEEKELVDPKILIEVEKNLCVLLSNGDSQVYYADIADALAAATSGSKITILGDTATDKGLMVHGWITLDLNGYRLTAKSLFGSPASQVIDSSENGAGVLDATLESLSASNPQLPLYDSARGGYRFFTGSVKALGVREGDNDNAYFWFRMEFANPEAYQLLANGDSGMAIGGSLLVGEDVQREVSFDNETVVNYADLVKKAQNPENPNYGSLAGIYLNVKSICRADGKEIILIPSATSGGVTVTVSKEDIELLTRKAELKWEEGSGFWDEV